MCVERGHLPTWRGLSLVNCLVFVTVLSAAAWKDHCNYYLPSSVGLGSPIGFWKGASASLLLVIHISFLYWTRIWCMVLLNSCVLLLVCSYFWEIMGRMMCGFCMDGSIHLSESTKKTNQDPPPSVSFSSLALAVEICVSFLGIYVLEKFIGFSCFQSVMLIECYFLPWLYGCALSLVILLWYRDFMVSLQFCRFQCLSESDCRFQYSMAFLLWSRRSCWWLAWGREAAWLCS